MNRRLVHSPEHVLIELRPAGLGRRAGAFLVDLVLLAALLFSNAQLGGLLPEAISALVTTTLGFLIFWGYHVAFELLWDGRTPGKRLLRLRVVDKNGLPVSLPQSLVRNLVRIVDLVPACGLGLLSAILDEDRARLGDRVADTLVVSEDPPSGPPPLTPGSRRFNSLRTARVQRLVRHRLGLEERELLYALCLRADALEAQARYRLFEEVGAWLRELLAIEEPELSGEAIVRGVAVLCAGRGESPPI